MNMNADPRRLADALQPRFWDGIRRCSMPPGELVIWDNWRLVHSASGHSREHGRLVHRTTIEGDYGLGRWETEPEGAGAMEMAG